MSVPAIVDDGNYGVALQCNCSQPLFPFFGRGDKQSFEVVVTLRIASVSYRRLALMSTRTFTGLGLAYLVDTTPTRDIGNGIVEYDNTYASVPATRFEGTSVNYPYQFLRAQTSFSQGFGPEAGDVVAPEVVEWPLPVAGNVKFEYSINRPDVLVAPKVIVIAGAVVKYGGWNPALFVANTPVLAFDSEIELYRGAIYQRRSIYINSPPFQVSR